MGLFESLTSFFVSEAYAEEPQEPKEEEDNEEGGEEGQDKGEEDGEGEEGGDEAADGEEEEEEDEDDEEEEEPEDPAPRFQEECAKTAACAPLKHEYEECVARVTAAADDEDHKGPHEDCVEEFFEMTHCVAQCAAPKLFRVLK